MPPIRQADDVSIVDWGAELSIIGEIRALVEAGAARRVLLNMAACQGLRADDLETLTEAFTVCQDRGCQIGMFGVSDSMARLVEVMDLAGDLPPVLGKGEQEALTALRAGKQITAGNGRPQAAAQQPIIDFDLDPAHAPTARFDPHQVMSDGAPAPAPAPTGQQGDDDLLAIDWTPLLATGYQLGGQGAAQLMNSLGPVPATSALPPRPAEVPTRAARRPPAVDDDVIDLGDLAPARVPLRDRTAFKTEVLPAFDLEQADRDQPDRTPTRVLGGRGDGDADFSPVDTGQGGPPPAFLRQHPGQHPGQPTPPPPGHGLPTHAQPGQGRAGAERKSERLTGRPPQQVPAAAAAAPPAHGHGGPGSPVNPYYESASLMESDDQTVMIQPGMIDAAMLASVMAEAAPPAPVSEPQAQGEEDDETVMFQPSALDAALLAEVAAVAGPESTLAPPRVEEPPQPAPPPGLPPAAVAAVTAAARAGEDAPPDGRDVELRLFLHDHALSSPLHLQVLEKLVKSSEATFGKTDLQLATGSPTGAVSSVLDQLVQSRLVRRTRSPRVRGGTGFVLSASPQARNTLVRLIKAWQAPSSRAKVAGWLDAGVA